MRGDDLGLIHGLPVMVKDLDTTSGIRTTYGSRLHQHDIPDADQGSVAQIKAQGGIVLGKTNTPEFGAGEIHATCCLVLPAIRSISKKPVVGRQVARR